MSKNAIAAAVALLLVAPLLCAAPQQETQTVIGEGVTDIRDGLVEPAREIAIARAQWDAVSKVAGIAIQSETLVINSALAEDVIMTEVRGTVRASRVISEEIKLGIIRIKAEVTVDTAAAQKKAEDLIRNMSIVVLTPSTFRGATKSQNRISEPLVQTLVKRGATVIDETVAAAGMTPQDLEAAIGGSSTALRAAGTKFLSNLALIGKIEGTVLTEPGVEIPFVGRSTTYVVRASFAYRLIALTGSGSTAGKILASGNVEATGMGNTAEAAFDNAVQALSRPALDSAIPQVEKFFDASRRSVEIRVEGNIDLSVHAQIKEALGEVQWLSRIEDRGLGSFAAESREKQIYLAYSLDRKPGLKVVSFTDRAIVLAWKKP